MDNYLQSKRMLRLEADLNAYYRHDSSDTVILLLYVDDVKVTGTSFSLISELKQQ